MAEVKKKLTLGLGIFFIIVIFLTAGCSRGNGVLTVSGTVEATQTDLNAEVSGQVLEVLVQEGTKVKPGDLIARIDASTAELQLQQAEAGVKAAEAQLADTQAGSRSEQIEQAQANLDSLAALKAGAERNLAYRQENFKRISQLFAEGAVSKQNYDDSQAQLDAAQAQLQQAEAQYRAAEAYLRLLQEGATADTVTAVEANLDKARAARDAAKLQVEKAKVKAVTAGTVVAVNIEPGETVVPGVSLVTLADLDNLWVKVFVPENQLDKVKLGDKVRIRVDAYPKKSFTGEVIYIASEAEFTPKNIQTQEERANTVFAVKVKVLDGNGELKPGMPADVEIGGAGD